MNAAGQQRIARIAIAALLPAPAIIAAGSRRAQAVEFMLALQLFRRRRVFRDSFAVCSDFNALW
jgi:hypothetical protein